MSASPWRAASVAAAFRCGSSQPSAAETLALCAAQLSLARCEHPDGLHRYRRRGPARLERWVLFATGDEDMRLIAQNHALLASHFRVATTNGHHHGLRQAPDLSARGVARHRMPAKLSSLRLGKHSGSRKSNSRSFSSRRAAMRSTTSPEQRLEADDRDALVSLYRRAASLVGSDAVIVQEWIPETAKRNSPMLACGPRQAGRLIGRAESAAISGRFRPIEHLRRDG